MKDEKELFAARMMVLRVLALVWLLAVFGCSSEERHTSTSSTESAPIAEAPAVPMAERIATLISRSRQATVAVDDGESTRSLGRRLPPPKPLVPPTPRAAPLPPGKRLLALDPSEGIPNAVQPLADGRVLLAWNDRIEAVTDTGARSTLYHFGARQLRPDATGDRLLVATNGAPGLLILDANNLAELRRIEASFEGAQVYWWTDEGALLMVPERINFSANEEVRIMIQAWLLPLDTLEAVLASFGTARFSSLGFDAPTGIGWAVLRTPYLITPMPGPLLRLVDGAPSGELTRTRDASDHYPAGAMDGSLYLVRTRRVDGASGRLLRRGPEGVEDLLTATPTYRVGVRPRDGLLAFIASDAAHAPAALWVATNAECVANTGAIHDFGEPWRIEQLARVEATLRAEFAKLPIAAESEELPFGTVLLRPFTAAELQELTMQFRQAVAALDGTPLTADLAGMQRLDNLLTEAEGLWTEHPAMLGAIAGFIGETLATAGAQWEWRGATEDLSTEFAAVVVSDGLTMTMALPFAAARDALSGDLALAEFTQALITTAHRPIFLVENAGDQTRAVLQLRELAVLDLDNTELQLEELLAAIGIAPSNDTVLLLTYSVAKENDDFGVMAACGHQLAANNPASAEAFALLGEALQGAGYRDEALAAMDWSAELAGADPGILRRRVLVLFESEVSDRVRRAAREVLNLTDDPTVELEMNNLLSAMGPVEEDAP